MNMKISIVSIDDIPSTIKEAGKWRDLWRQVAALPVDSKKGIAVELDNKREVERARSAMLAYTRRAKVDWRVHTRSTAHRPNTLYIWRVSA